MKTGTIVLAQHSGSPGERRMAERCAGFLESRGRKNVRIAYHYGSPRSEDVMARMFDDGVDTFAIVPLSISEGRMTVWLMPDAMGLPDNCGSWTMMGGRDVATRFATALGRDPAMASALAEREGEPVEGTAVLVLAHGSSHSQCARTSEFYADALRRAGWRAECAYCRHDRGIKDAVSSLAEEGYGRIRVVPLFIAFDGRSASEARGILRDAGVEVEYSEPVSEIPLYLETLDAKVPEGWRGPAPQTCFMMRPIGRA